MPAILTPRTSRRDSPREFDTVVCGGVCLADTAHRRVIPLRSRRKLMSRLRSLAAVVVVALVVVVAAPAPTVAETTLRVVMHSDLKIVDPIWTTAYIVRNHGYMIYDTLFAMDAKGDIKPQMFDKYKARPEPPSALAGGKVVKVDRVEWKWIPDHQTAMNALIAGEVDYLEAPPHDLLPIAKADANVKLVDVNPLGNQYTFRFNALARPFDNAKVRQAVFYTFNQEDFLKAVVGDPAYYKVCKSFFPCGSPLSSPKGMEGLLESNFEKSKALLKEAGYDGTPIVLMHSTDLAVLTNLAPVAKSLLEKGGFKVDMVSMDWQTLVARRAKKDPPAAGGWHAFLTSWVAADILNPVMMGFMNASCDKAMFGWPCDKEIESLRDQFARETNPAKQKAIAEAVQVRETQYPTHIPLGQWYGAFALRKNVDGVLEAPVTIFWNVTKK